MKINIVGGYARWGIWVVPPGFLHDGRGVVLAVFILIPFGISYEILPIWGFSHMSGVPLDVLQGFSHMSGVPLDVLHYVGFPYDPPI